MSEPSVLYLREGESRRVRRGHPWVFSNEIDTKRSPLTVHAPGDLVALRDTDGSFVAWADLHPNTLLCARVLSRVEAAPPDAAWLTERIDRAARIREHCYDAPFYRLVYADGDGLSGLIIDRFADVLVVQTGSAGMERRLDVLCEVLEARFAPRAIVLKNDAHGRAQEGLDSYVRVAAGSFDGPLEVAALGERFAVPLESGQKTGWYYDHTENRRWLVERWLRRVPGARVLDLYAYVGAWSIPAARAGAQVTAVDSSAAALATLTANAAGAAIETLALDVPKALAQLATAERRFDVVVVDPPAFIRRRADEKAGKEAYRRLNADALRLLAPGGLLVTASCSALMAPEDHLAAVRTAARQTRRELALIHRGGPGPDHPIHPLVPQSEYLKCLCFAALDG